MRLMQFGIIYLMAFILLSCSPAAQAGSEKYAFVDVVKVFDGYQKTKENDQVLQKAAEEKENERNAILTEVRQLTDELELLSDEAKKTKQATLDEKVRLLQEFDMKARQELGDKRRDMAQEIFNDIDVVVQEYGKKNDFDFILNDRAVLYHRDLLNVTEDVLKELNKNYSSKNETKNS